MNVLTGAGDSQSLEEQSPPEMSGVSVFEALGCLTSVVLDCQLLWAIRKDLR
jgi:hypothetical protein